MLQLAANEPFDDRVNQNATLNDLSRDLMRQYLEQVGSELCRSCAIGFHRKSWGARQGVVRGPQEAPLPVNVGLMMFNAEPHRFFPAMGIDFSVVR